jgi:hypothetical protein
MRARNFFLSLFENQLVAANLDLLPMAWVSIFLYLKSLKTQHGLRSGIFERSGYQPQ